MTATKRATTRRRHGFASIAASVAVLGTTFLFYGYAARVSGQDRGRTYSLNSTFLSSDGLTTGADVLLAGVPIGAVTSITLDRVEMVSHVSFVVDRAIRLPKDSRLSIGSPGLMSANALLIDPGHSRDMLSAGGMLTDTCGATNLEQQVSQYIFGNGGASTGC